MASFNDPKITNRIADDVPAIRILLTSLAKFDPATGNTDIPNGAKRLVETSSGYEFQSYNGTAWVALEKWNIDVQKVDGYSASTGTTASTIPVRDSSGKLPGDITGNAATATKAAALSAANPVAMGGTGATTAAGARENLGVPPTDHSSTATTYGAGNATEYGHNKLSDATDSSLGVNDGTAATPKAVKTVADSVVALASAQEAKNASQDTAISNAATAAANAQSSANAAQQSANNAQTTADSALAAAEEAASKAGLPLGFEYTRLTGQTPPFGGVDYLGQTATRAMYADLWAWLQANKPDAIVSESEWQSLYSSQNGNVAKYSTGDGSTTFRFPRMVGYAKGAARASEIGGYTTEGLPNITGEWQNWNQEGRVMYNIHANSKMSGAFKLGSVSATRYSGYDNANVTAYPLAFDASLSNSIYGNSDHVTPETVTVVMGVIAIGAVAEIGTATEAGLVAEVAEISGNVGALENGVGRASAYITETWRSGTEWYRKWSDGWIEQGGVVQGVADLTSASFLTPFSTTQYSVYASYRGDSADGSATSFNMVTGVVIQPYTTTQFKYALWNGQSFIRLQWYACGY